MDWPTALAIFLPPFAALTGVVIGALMSRSTQREALTFEARRKRIERLETAVGETKALLLDSDPQRVSMNFHPDRSIELVEELGARWQAVRPTILATAAMDGAPKLRTAMSELARSVHNTLNSNAWIIADLSSNSELARDSIEDGREHHEAAIQALDNVATLLRESSHESTRPRG